MLNLILASEAVTPPGDELETIAFIALGLSMLVTAIATVIVTPKGEKH